MKTHAVYIALCAHEPARCCRNSGRIRRKMSEGRWRTDASTVPTMRLVKITPRGAPENAKNVMPKSRSTRTTDAEAAGNKMRTRRTPSALSDTWMPEPLHECPRSPPNPSPSQYLGARNDKQNHCVHLPAGAVADDEVHCARSTNTGSGGGERRAGLGCAAEPDVTLASALLNSPQSRTGAGMTMGMTSARRGRRTGR